jgi:hypothetical protein
MSQLILFDRRYTICRLNPDDAIPSWVNGSGFWAMTHTADELSIVCEENWVPEGIKVEMGWRMFKVRGPLEFSQVGVLSALSGPLAQAKVSIFAISTFDTDYILVKEALLQQAVGALRQNGHIVEVA